MVVEKIVQRPEILEGELEMKDRGYGKVFWKFELQEKSNGVVVVR